MHRTDDHHHHVYHDDGSVHNDNCPCGHFDEHHYPDLDTAADIVDYATAGHVNDDGHDVNCPCHDDGAGFVYVRRDDLDNLAVRINDDLRPGWLNNDLHRAARRLVDNARPATTHNDTTNTDNLTTLIAEYVCADALCRHADYTRPNRERFNAASAALIAALRTAPANRGR